jgi:hypothetical protein
MRTISSPNWKNNLHFSSDAKHVLLNALSESHKVEKIEKLHEMATHYATWISTRSSEYDPLRLRYVSVDGADIYFRVEPGPAVVVEDYAF